MSKMLFVWIQLLMCFAVTRARPRHEEPMCPKFYYEEKTLEKVVRIEHRLELQERTIDQLEEQLKNQKLVISKYETKIQYMGDELQKKIRSFNASVIPTVVFQATEVTKSDICAKEIVKYNKLLMNIGGGYDIETGYFTATVSGVYMFNAHVCSQQGQHVHLFIVADGKAIASTTYHGQGDGACFSFGGVAALTQGQTAAVVGSYDCRDAFFDNPHRWNTFSGILIKPIKS